MITRLDDPRPPPTDKLLPVQYNCLSYWGPRLDQVGVPVPDAILVRPGMDLFAHLRKSSDGLEFSDQAGLETDAYQRLLDDLRAALADLGDQCAVLRTGRRRGDRGGEPAYLPGPEHIESALGRLVVASHGMPEYPPSRPDRHPLAVLAVCRDIRADVWYAAVGGLGLPRGYLAFLHDGAVVCIHRRWPATAAAARSFPPDAYDALYANEFADMGRVFLLADQAAQALDLGDWVLDCVRDQEDKWWVVDAALNGTAGHDDHLYACANRQLLSVPHCPTEAGDGRLG